MIRSQAFRLFLLLALVFTFAFSLNLFSAQRLPRLATSALAQGTPLPAPIPVWRLTEGPQDASVFGLAVLNHQIYVTTYNGVWVSADGGTTWQSRNQGLPGLPSFGLHAHDGALFVATNSGIYRSRDGGQTWQAANVGLPDSQISHFLSEGDRLYAVIYGSGLFFTTDKGETWTPQGGLPTNAVPQNAAIRGNNFWVSTSRGIYRSADRGQTWTRAQLGLPVNAAITNFAFAGERLLAGLNGYLQPTNSTSPGVYTWEEREGRWKAVNQGLEFTEGVTLFANGNDVFAGTGAGAFRFDAERLSWTSVSNGLRGSTYGFGGTGAGLYAVSGGDLFLSTNRGASWRALNVKLASVQNITAFAFNNTALYAASTSGIYRRLNVGRALWERASEGLTDSFITDLTTQGANLWATGYTGKAFFSSNHGQAWTEISTGLNKAALGKVAANERTVIVGSRERGVFRLVKRDGEDFWELSNRGFLNPFINDLLAVNNTFFAATYDGVYRSTDDGASWVAVNQGLSLTQDGVSYEAHNLSADGATVYAVLTPRTAGGVGPIIGTVNGGSYRVFRSSNNGATWTRVEFSPGVPAEFEQVLPTAQGLLAFGTGQAVNPVGIPVFSFTRVWFSNDKAASWLAADAGLLNPNLNNYSFYSGLLGATPTQALLAPQNGEGLYVRDLVAMSCRYEVAAPDRVLPPTATTLSLNLRTTSNCGWQAASRSDWITIASSQSGTGNGEVRLNIAANTTKGAREGSVIIGGTTINLSQAACELGVSPLQPRFEANGGTGNLAITTDSSCQWEISSNANWITLPPTRSSAGNATVSFTVAANPNNQPRTATLFANHVAVTITQAAAQGSCVAQPLTANQWKRDSFVDSDCAADFYSFNGQPNQRWFVTYYGPGAEPEFRLADATGNALVVEPVFRAAVFRGGPDLRLMTFKTNSTGIFTLALAAQRSPNERPYWLKLSLAECVSRIRGNDRELRATGDSDTLTISTSVECLWQATSTAAWLRLATAGNVITYTAEANPGVARQADILVGDLRFPVKQAAGVEAKLTLTGLEPSFFEAGTSGALLNVTGGGFNSSSRVLFGGKALATTFVSATQLRAAVPSIELAAAREVAITVETMTPNVWQTPSLPFVIRPAQQFWTATNGPGGGYITALYRQGSRLWASTATGRIFLSDDGGTNWRRHASLLGEDNTPSFISKLAGFGDQLFAATSIGVYRLNLSQPHAVWKLIPLSETEQRFLPYYANGLVAKTDSVFAVINNQLFRATATSERWTRVSEIPNTETPLRFSNIQLVTTGTAANAPLYALVSSFDITNQDRTLSVSVDEGRTWRQILLRFPPNPQLPSLGMGLHQQLFALNGRVYFGLAYGVFRLNERDQIEQVGNLSDVPGSAPQNVTALYQDGDTLYANSTNYTGSFDLSADSTGPTLFRLASNGNWERADEGLESAPITGLLAAPSGLLAGTSNGLWLSANRGNSWATRNQGLNAVGIQHTTTIGNALFAASYDAIYRTVNNGQTWTRADHGLPLNLLYGIGIPVGVGGVGGIGGIAIYQPGVMALAANGDTLYAALPQGIFRSTNQGQSWLNTGLAGYQIYALGFANQQVLASAWKYGSSTLGLGTPTSAFDAGIYRTASTVGGWRTSESSLFGNFPTSLATLDDKVFAGSTNSGVRVSDDNGQTWRNSSTGLNTNTVLSLAALGNTLLAGTNEGVYRSSDQGQSWRLTSAPAGAYRQLVTQDNTAYALGETRLYRTDNLGEAWRELPPALQYELTTVQPLGTRLFAGTSADGVLMADLAPATATAVNAASYAGGSLAPLSIATLFGSNFSTATELAPGGLAEELAGTRVLVRSSNGKEAYASLLFVSPGQINLLLPANEPASAPAQIFVISRNGAQSIANLEIANLALGLFTANGNGQGVAAAVALRVRSDGSSSYEAISRFDTTTNRFVATPIDVSATNGTVYLVLYGTGISRRANADSVTAMAGETPLNVVYAGPQGNFVGLDQLNLALPAALAGRGDIELRVTVNGKAANAVRIAIR